MQLLSWEDLLLLCFYFSESIKMKPYYLLPGLESPCGTGMPVYFWSCVAHIKTIFRCRLSFKWQYLLFKSFQALMHCKDAEIPALGSNVLTKFHTLLISQCSFHTLGSLVAHCLLQCGAPLHFLLRGAAIALCVKWPCLSFHVSLSNLGGD